MRLEIDSREKTIKVKGETPNLGQLMEELMEILPNEWHEYRLIGVGIEITPIPTQPYTPPTPTWPNRPGDFWYDNGWTVTSNRTTTNGNDYGEFFK